MATPAGADVVAFLRTVPLLAHVPEAELRLVAPRLTPQTFAPGEPLVQEGETAATCYLIVSGQARVVSRDLIGRETTLALLGPGETVGEMALVVDGRRTATVRARTTVLVYALSRSDFDYLAAVCPAFAQRVRQTVLVRLHHSFLRKASIFAELPEPALQELAAQLLPLRVPASTVIVAAGEPGDCFYLIRDGRVRVTRGSTVLAELAQGDFFGETALLADVPRTATVRAITDCELLALDKVTFRSVVQRHATLQARFREMLRIRWSGGAAAARQPAAGAVWPAPAGPDVRGGRRWRRWWQILVGGTALFALLTAWAVHEGGGLLLHPTLIAGALVGPVVFVTFLAEAQLLPERASRLAFLFLVTGAVGVPLAGLIQWGTGAARGGLLAPPLIAVVEELVKVLPVLWFLRGRTSRFLMDGIVFGAAAGMGFAAFESSLYGLVQAGSVSGSLTTVWLRALLSPFTHGTWTALLTAALWRTRQGGGWRPAILAFGTVVVLHTAWNWMPTPAVRLLIWLLAVGGVGLMLLQRQVQQATAEQAQAMQALSPEAAGTAGAPGGLRCRQCGSAAPVGARYCPRCGVALKV